MKQAVAAQQTSRLYTITTVHELRIFSMVVLAFS